MSEESKQNNDDALPQPIKEVEPAPDGGLKAWLTILGSFLSIFVQFGLVNSFGVFQVYYETMFPHLSPSTISWVGGVQQFILFGGGLFIGRLFDAYGAHVLLIPGSILLVLGLMLTSICTEFYQVMLAHGVLFGIGTSLTFHPSSAVPGQWFHRRRAFAMSFAIAGSGLGGTLWPVALKQMFDTIGFAWALRVVGFISLVLLVTANMLIRTRLPRKTPAPLSTTFHPFKEAQYTLLALCAAFTFLGLFTPFFYSTTRAESMSSATITGYTVSLINAGSTIGRLLGGIGDKVGRFNVLVVSAVLTGTLLLAFWIPAHTLPAILAFCVMYGFVAGVYIAVVSTCVAQISHVSAIGHRIGLLWALVGFVTLAGPPINGALIAQYPGEQGYRLAGAFSGAVIILGAASGLAARLRSHRSLLAVV